MTRPLSIFLDVAKGIEAVENAVADIVGHSFVEQHSDSGSIYRLVAFYIDMRLFEDHGLENDCGIKFAEYKYQLQLIPFQDGMAIPEFDAMYERLVMFLAAKLSNAMMCKSIVVANLQCQLAEFVPSY